MNKFMQTAALCTGIGILLPLPVSALTVYSQSGVDAAAIQTTVDAFRADLGTNNGLGPCVGGCAPGVGRREINWDAVTDAFSSGGANPFPGNFFNLAAGSPAGRVRGAQFSSSGTFEVSADADSNGDGNSGPTAILFGNHTPDNAVDFAAFSAERIFGLIGTNEMDVTFSVPGSPLTRGLVRGFGAVFTDVELAGAVRLDFFDANDSLLHSEAAPAFSFAGPDSFKSFSFVGVSFASAQVSRVHIVNGGFDLNLQQFGLSDAAAMDDFIYGEPAPVPLPAAAWLFGAALFGLRLRRQVMDSTAI